MKFTTVIRPSVIESLRKVGILNKIAIKGDSGRTYFRYGSNVFIRDSKNSNRKNVVIAYNLEKRRPVKKIMKGIFSGKNGLPVNKTKILERGKWIAHVYEFPYDLLDSQKLKVVQGTRTFKLVPNT